jgi:hypothetical protein
MPSAASPTIPTSGACAGRSAETPAPGAHRLRSPPAADRRSPRSPATAWAARAGSSSGSRILAMAPSGSASERPMPARRSRDSRRSMFVRPTHDPMSVSIDGSNCGPDREL